MRIAIVNDLYMAIEALRRILSKIAEFEIAWIALNGEDAVRKCKNDTPDMILMDLNMPVMDGVEATRRIMKSSPCAILIVTATVDGNIAKVFDAMSYGALDAVNTPVLGTPEGEAPLLEKIEQIKRLIHRPKSNIYFEQENSASIQFNGSVPFLVAIGASTGGPQALSEILSKLPPDFGATIVIIQHVDMLFASGLVEWLNKHSHMPVSLAKENDALKPAHIFVAGTNDHLVIKRDLTFHYTENPKECPYRPSVDAFFKSIDSHWPEKAIAVLLTGMGRDGADGLLALKNSGWHTIAQDEKTSVVYGMPKAAIEQDAAISVLSVDKIALSLESIWLKRTKLV